MQKKRRAEEARDEPPKESPKIHDKVHSKTKPKMMRVNRKDWRKIDAENDEYVLHGLTDEDETPQDVLGINENGSNGSSKTTKKTRVVEATMDSGASQSVAPPEAVPEAEVKESDGSRRGQNYVSASGDRVPNMGEQVVKFVTPEGRRSKLKWQNAPITKPLLSISHICDNGHEVMFTKTGGTIRNLKSGRTTTFRRKNNVYVLDMAIETDDVTKVSASGFIRQGK